MTNEENLLALDEVCKECGYLGYPEIINISKLKPSAIWSALNYLPVKKT